MAENTKVTKTVSTKITTPKSIEVTPSTRNIEKDNTKPKGDSPMPELSTIRLFTKEAFRTLKHYVFCYQDKKGSTPFYIGYGSKNDVFRILSMEIKADKALESKLKEFRESGVTVEPMILAYGLNRTQAETICKVISGIAKNGWVSQVRLE